MSDHLMPLAVPVGQGVGGQAEANTGADAAFARTPEPPYLAVIFSSRMTDDRRGYEAMGEAMHQLALARPGCLGVESTRDAEGFGITVSYWTDEEAILSWKDEARHLAAQRMGVERWYQHYELRVARVERAYDGPEGRSP